MIIGFQPSLSSYKAISFGNGEQKPEEPKPAEAPVQASESIMDSPDMRRLQEESFLYQKERQEYDDLSKYDQYAQRGLIVASAASAFLGNIGGSVFFAAYPIGKSIYTMLKRLGEWKI